VTAATNGLTSLEVDSPGGGLGIEAQGAKGNLDLERPTNVAASRVCVPDAVPCALSPTVRELECVPHQPVWVHFKEITGLLVQERVHHPHEPVVGPQSLVTLHRVPEQPVRLGVEAEHPHVEVLAIENDPDLRAFGRDTAEVRILLDEVRRGDSPLPDGFVKEAVERDRLSLHEAFSGHRTPTGGDAAVRHGLSRGWKGACRAGLLLRDQRIGVERGDEDGAGCDTPDATHEDLIDPRPTMGPGSGHEHAPEVGRWRTRARHPSLHCLDGAPPVWTRHLAACSC
jgi:hypothetical protein